MALIVSILLIAGITLKYFATFPQDLIIDCSFNPSYRWNYSEMLPEFGQPFFDALFQSFLSLELL